MLNVAVDRNKLFPLINTAITPSMALVMVDQLLKNDEPRKTVLELLTMDLTSSQLDQYIAESKPYHDRLGVKLDPAEYELLWKNLRQQALQLIVRLFLAIRHQDMGPKYVAMALGEGLSNVDVALITLFQQGFFDGRICDQKTLRQIKRILETIVAVPPSAGARSVVADHWQAIKDARKNGIDPKEAARPGAEALQNLMLQAVRGNFDMELDFLPG